jgi:uncharacterized protein (DUF2147 family)
MKIFKITLLFFCCFSIFSANAQSNHSLINEQSILGNWSILDNQVAVEILKVDGEFQGRIIWLADPNERSGLPKLDKYNLEKGKRSQSLMFLTCLYGFKYNPIANEFENGYFYNPFTGDTIKAKLKLGENNTLIMSGFAGFSLTFEEAIWVRM